MGRDGSTKVYTLVAIMWEDAQSVPTWASAEEIETAPVLTFGVLIRRDRKMVCVAQTVNLDGGGGAVADAIAIPFGMVRRVAEVGKYTLPSEIKVSMLPPHRPSHVLPKRGRRRKK